MSVLRGLGKVNPATTALFLCDMQVKFRPNIVQFDNIVANSARVVAAARLLGLPILASEQYPKGLGPTVPELKLAELDITAHSKTCFTMAIPALLDQLRTAQPGTRCCVRVCSARLLQHCLQVCDPVRY